MNTDDPHLKCHPTPQIILHICPHHHVVVLNLRCRRSCHNANENLRNNDSATQTELIQTTHSKKRLQGFSEMAMMRDEDKGPTKKQHVHMLKQRTSRRQTFIWSWNVDGQISHTPTPKKSSAHMEQNTQEQPTDTHSFGASNPMVKSATSPLLPRQTLASSASPDETRPGSKTHHQVNRSVQDRRMDAKYSGSLAKLASLVRVTSDVTMESFFCFD